VRGFLQRRQLRTIEIRLRAFLAQDNASALGKKLNFSTAEWASKHATIAITPSAG